MRRPISWVKCPDYKLHTVRQREGKKGKACFITAGSHQMFPSKGVGLPFLGNEEFIILHRLRERLGRVPGNADVGEHQSSEKHAHHRLAFPRAEFFRRSFSIRDSRAFSIASTSRREKRGMLPV